MIRVFLDANILIAAVASLSGGSAQLIEGCRLGRFEAFVSRLVLLEAERNIRKKLPPGAMARFHRILEDVHFRIVPAPTEEELHVYRDRTDEKDVPILAAAVASGSAYLVTLDRRHFMTERIKDAGFPCRVVTPKGFFASLSGTSR